MHTCTPTPYIPCSVKNPNIDSLKPDLIPLPPHPPGPRRHPGYLHGLGRRAAHAGMHPGHAARQVQPPTLQGTHPVQCRAGQLVGPGGMGGIVVTEDQGRGARSELGAQVLHWVVAI